MPVLFEPVARYTRFVLLGKRTLWLFAILLTVTLVVVARMHNEDTGSRIVLSGKNNKPPAVEPASMLHPHYQGFDSRNRPFTVIAERATQPDSDTVQLQSVSMDMTLEDNAWVAVTSNSGLYELIERQLDLDGNVHVFYEGGYEFRTQHISVDAAEGSAKGDLPVEGQGRSGTLKADRFTILDHGAIVWFLGNVHVVLYL